MEVDQYIDGVTSVLNLMRETFGDRIKEYYEGDPIEIPNAAHPCIIVQKVNSQTTVDATGTDKMVETLIIRLVLDKREDFGARSNVDLAERKLRLMVEGRDANGQYSGGTIMHALRTRVTLGSKVVENDTDVSYDVIPIGGGEARAEADVSVVLSERVIVTDRT